MTPIDYLRIYTRNNHNIMDRVRFDNKEILYEDYILARYDIDNGKCIFDFTLTTGFTHRYNSLYGNKSAERLSEELTEQQYRKKDYIDKPEWCYEIDYVIQSLKTKLSLEEALTFRFIRDKHNCNWEAVGFNVNQYTWQKIESILNWYKLEYTDQDLKHVALCTIYSI